MYYYVAQNTGAARTGAITIGSQTFTVTQDAIPHNLTVSKSGTGNGTVLSVPDGIKCGDSCGHGYDQGTTVTLKPIADTGSVFSGWSGACSGTGPCSISMDSDKTVQATFTSQGPAQANTMISIALSSGSILRNGLIDVTGRLRRLPDMGNDLIELTIVVTITGPDGQSLTQITGTDAKDGSFGIQGLTGFTQKGTYLIKASFSGTSSLAASVSPEVAVTVNSSPGYAVIVEGEIPTQEGLASHNKTTNRIYKSLKDRGFTDDNIRYFNYNNAQPGVDAVPSKHEIQTAVETWAAGNMNSVPGPFYFIMVDHGDSDTFYINGETITQNDLVSWFDKLESQLNPQALQEERTIIIGSCYSGSYIPYLSKGGRMIITSARADEKSYKGPMEDDNIRSGEFFLEELFDELRRGYSFRSSFEYAAKKILSFTSQGAGDYRQLMLSARQHPLLEDNADGKGSTLLTEGGDGQVAADLYLGTGLSYNPAAKDNPADITSVTKTFFLGPSETTALLWAKVNDNALVSSAWAEIQAPPETSEKVGQAASDQLELDLPKVPLQFNSSTSRREGQYGSFDASGRYEVYYYVKDKNTSGISSARRSVVYKAKEGNEAPSAFGLVSPADGLEQMTVLVLDWEDSLDPDGVTYTLLVSKNKDFSTIDYMKEDIPVSTTSIGLEDMLSDLTLWYWKVLAIDSYGAVRESSQTWSFITINNNTNGLPGIITGFITDAMTGTGIPYATGSLSAGGTFTSLPDGSYFMMVPTGTMTLAASANGYIPSELSLSISPGDTINKNIGLAPALTMPLPDTGLGYTYQHVNSPVLDPDPSKAKPFAVGDIEGGTLSLRVGLPTFSGPVDIYLVLYAPELSQEYWLIGQDLGAYAASNGPVKWREGTTGNIDNALYGDIPAQYLPPAVYNLYAVVTPAGSFDAYYVWSTAFEIR